jgi:hypothetical protein
VSVSKEAGARSLSAGLEPVPMLSVVLHGKRHGAYYLLKVIVPLLLIMAMSGSVFWLDPSQAGTQIGVSTTSMLTLIAYRFSIGSEIPRVPYLTRMDEFMLAATLLVFLTLVTAVYTAYLANRDNLARASRIEAICRVLYPVVAVLLFAGTLLF